MKVFQIGFNKCGTTSIYDFFVKNGYKSVGWEGGKLDTIFQKNQKNRQLLCHGYDDIVLWSDTSFLLRNFQIFAEQYPNAKFIYNVRNIDDWVRSRMNHREQIPYTNKEFPKVKQFKIPYDIFWKSEWIYHERMINEYFSGKHSVRLLRFNIDTDSGEKIAEFLPELEFKILKFPHSNKTKR